MPVLILVALLVSTSAFAQVQSRPTDPPLVSAAGESWYQLREPMVMGNDVYYHAGAAVFFNGNVMVRTGHYNGVPLYADATMEPYSVLYVPIGRGQMQPYERKRQGPLAGMAGSRLSGFPLRLLGDPGAIVTPPRHRTDATAVHGRRHRQLHAGDDFLQPGAAATAAADRRRAGGRRDGCRRGASARVRRQGDPEPHASREQRRRLAALRECPVGEQRPRGAADRGLHTGWHVRRVPRAATARRRAGSDLHPVSRWPGGAVPTKRVAVAPSARLASPLL